MNGAEIVGAVLVGAIEASDTDRNLITTASTFCYGVTDRFEINTKIRSSIGTIGFAHVRMPCVRAQNRENA